MTSKKKQKKTTAKRPRNYYSPETWATIAALYQSGRFRGRKELHAHCAQVLPQCPTESAIEKYISANGLSKRTLAGAIEEKKRERFVDLFSRLGARDEDCAQLIVDGMKAAADIKAEIYRDLEKMQAAAKKEDVPEYVEKLTEIVEKLKPYFSNLNSALNFARERFKLCGDYQAVKIKKMGGGGGGTGEPDGEDDDMTMDEIDAELKQLEAKKLL